MDYMKKPTRCGGEIRNIIGYESGESKKYKWGLWSWFYPIEGNNQRHDLCENLRRWLLVLKKTKIPMEILIGGMFITLNPNPSHVDVMCIIKRGLNLAVKQQLDNLLNNKSKAYNISIVEVLSIPKSKEDDVTLYNHALERFGFDKKYKPTIFRVCL